MINHCNKIHRVSNSNLNYQIWKQCKKKLFYNLFNSISKTKIRIIRKTKYRRTYLIYQDKMQWGVIGIKFEEVWLRYGQINPVQNTHCNNRKSNLRKKKTKKNKEQNFHLWKESFLSQIIKCPWLCHIAQIIFLNCPFSM